MKKGIMAVALAVSAAIASAQEGTVTFERVLDTATAGPASGNIHAATYVPVADKFIASRGGNVVEVYNSATGAYETQMSLSGLTATGLGVFALTASEDGVIYGWEEAGGKIWRWDSIADPAPENVYDNALFARVGYTGKVGNEVIVAFTGAASYGSVQFFSDTFPFSTSSFAWNETVDLDAKSALAISRDGTIAFTSGDAPQATNLSRFDKTEAGWNSAPTWQLGTLASPYSGPGAGPMAYDDVHDILFHAPAPGSTLKLNAHKGSDGSIVGSADLASPLYTTGGYAGGWVEPTATGGTVYLIGRSNPQTSTVMYVYNYTVEGASVDDWSLYQQ